MNKIKRKFRDVIARSKRYPLLLNYNLLLSEAHKVIVVRLETTAFHERERERERERESMLERSEELGNESLCSRTVRFSAEKNES